MIKLITVHIVLINDTVECVFLNKQDARDFLLDYYNFMDKHIKDMSLKSNYYGNNFYIESDMGNIYGKIEERKVKTSYDKNTTEFDFDKIVT